MNLIILIVILVIGKTVQARMLVNNSKPSPNIDTFNITDENEPKESWNPGNHGNLYFNDIIPNDLSRNADEDNVKLWPNGLVYFKIDEGFGKERIHYILRAMIMICRSSCVCFIPAEENRTTYLQISISETQGLCGAQVGYSEGIVDYILPLDELDKGCFTIGTILHELMHVIGFVHQHNVPNRDRYVKIIEENIAEGFRQDFMKWSKAELPYGDLPYDFSSIMHYPLNAYSMNGRRTIIPLVDTGNVYIGHGKTLSQLDVQKLNIIYNCTCTH